MKTTIGKAITAEAKPKLDAIAKLLEERGVTGVTPEQAAARFVRYVANEETIDTTGDLIKASAWDVSEWLANAGLFADHRKVVEMKVGYGLNAWVDGKRLMVDAFFLPSSIAPNPALVDGLYKMVAAGVNPDCSVGFWPKPDAYHWANDEDRLVYGKGLRGMIYSGCWLKELSPCGVGAHPGAKVEAIAKGLKEGVFNPDEIKAFAGVEDLAGLFERALWRIEGKVISAPPPPPPELTPVEKQIQDLTAIVAKLTTEKVVEAKPVEKRLGIVIPFESLQIIAAALEAAESEIEKYIQDENENEDGPGTPADPPPTDPLAGEPEEKAADIAKSLNAIFRTSKTGE